MKVYATTAMQEPGVATYLPLFARLAAQDRYREHTLCEDPGQADLILFLDGHQHYRDMELSAIREHPLVQRYREKAFVYSEMDQPWCAMPGLYVSMPRTSFDPRRQRACSYINLPNSHVAPSPAQGDSLLFSFLGRAGNGARDRVLKLKHPRAEVADTSATDFFGAQTDAVEKQRKHYASVIARSKFVLCPKGAGPSSFRVFETMSAGRVPVIISDLWVPPAGPDWNACAIFIPEKQIERIGEILEKQEDRFPAMAAAARREWEQWFAPDVLFHRMTEALSEIIQTRRISESVLCRKVTARYLYLRAREAKAKIKGLIHSFAGHSSARSRQLFRSLAHER
jgi:hypothetical protein